VTDVSSLQRTTIEWTDTTLADVQNRMALRNPGHQVLSERSRANLKSQGRPQIPTNVRQS